LQKLEELEVDRAVVFLGAPSAARVHALAKRRP
jgi:hypothetical protein